MVVHRPLVFVSSFSIFALIISFMILLIFGYSTYGVHIDASVLPPPSLSSLFSSMGVPAFSLGYNFSFLSFYVLLSHGNDAVERSKAVPEEEVRDSQYPEYLRCNGLPRTDAHASLFLIPWLS